jgi:hypothetical protein
VSISDQVRDKITMAVMLALGDGKQAGFLTMSDERRLAAGRVYGQVILPLLRKAWDDGYGSGRDDEAQSWDIGHTPNPYAKES